MPEPATAPEPEPEPEPEPAPASKPEPAREPERAVLLREGPAARTWRVEGAGGRVLRYEKRYDVLWPWRPLAWLLKLNLPCLSAAREAANARALARAGVPVPPAETAPAVLRLDIGRFGVRLRGVVRIAPAAGEPLDAWLAREGSASERGHAGEGARQARRAVASRLGALVRRLHDAGRYHRDLYLCHVFVAPGSARPPALSLIDVARADRRRWLRRRWVTKDLGALQLSSASLATNGDRLAFLRAYAGGAPARALVRRLARAATRKAAALGLRGRKG